MSKKPKLSVVESDGTPAEPAEEVKDTASHDAYLERAIDRVFGVLAKSCGEDEAGFMLEPLVIAINTILPFYPNGDDPSECEEYIKLVFEAVVKHYGEDEARRIFSPYGRLRTKREINDEANEELLVLYYLECIEAEKSKRKPNVRQLALRIAKEKKVDPVALERKIWRVIKEKPEIKNNDNLGLIALASGVVDKIRHVMNDGIIELSRRD
jgi:hypothetical protein